LTSGWSSANTGTYSWGENYSIDAWGNLQISPMGGKAHGGNFTLTGNSQNRSTGLSYDAAGNLMSYLSATYTYDQENRLSSTAGMSYTYDGNGERVLKSNTSTGAAVKRYWSMGGNTLAEGDGSGNLTAENIYFGGNRIARIDLPANTVHYYLSDHLGSTSVVASAAGAIEEESDYSPFGTEMIVTGPGVNELKFTGKRRDTESQLDYFGARYYSNAYGRFLTPDWAAHAVAVPYANFSNPQSLNLYSYTKNNPTTFGDPDGHCCTAGEFGRWLDRQLTKFESTKVGKVYSFTQSLSPSQATNPLAVAHFVANSANIGTATGTVLGGDHTTMQKVDAIAHDVKAAGELTIVLATAGKSMVPTAPVVPESIPAGPTGTSWINTATRNTSWRKRDSTAPAGR
jgi:RHS repeat-associated protein